LVALSSTDSRSARHSTSALGGCPCFRPRYTGGGGFQPSPPPRRRTK
jgi:hypothetical protein